MAKYVSGRHKNLKVGIASYSENLTSLEVIGNVGIATTNATSKLYVVGDAIITGVITASSFSGNATTASYATNAGVATYASTAGVATALQNSRTFEITGDIVASPISFDGSGNVSLAATIQPNSVGLGTDTTGNYVASVTNGSYITGADGGSEGSVLTIGVAATSTNTANQVVARDSSGNFSAGTITANLTGTASTASFATTAFNLSNAANITTGTIDSARLSGTYNIDISGNAATSDYADVAGIATYASTAGVATALQNSRTFEITGDIVASPISFNGTGNVSLAATIQPNSVALGGDTTGDYVQTVSGTIGQITVTGGTGEGSTPVISIASNPTLPGNVTVGNDLQVNNNLNVTGNITVGGTAGFILVENFRVSDADIVLGFTTNASNQDVSNDTTANHGGIAVASTEGNPLVNLNIAGIETLPATYKKIMWFKAGSFAGLNTDAWLSNYAIGIGSTQFPSGTRLAAGSVQFTEQDLAVVRNINASGIITGTLANNLTLNTSGTGLSGVATYNNSGATTFTVTSNATSNNTPSTIVARDASGNFSAGTISANLTGTASTAQVATALQNSRTFEITGDIVASPISFDGTGNVSLAATIQPNSVALGSDTTGNYVASVANGSYITGADGGSEGSTLTIGVAATSVNTANQVVARDASGNFSAGTITANLTGTASTASFATTAYNLTDAANITTGTINSSRLSGTYNINISGNAATATYASTAGVATYASNAGIATYASNAGIATYADSAGIATVAQNVTGSPNITVSSVNSTGIVTALSFSGSGSNLTGIVTQIIAGTNISINPTGGTGAVTVNSNAITGVLISTNTTNQSQYLIYSTSTGSTTGFGVSTSGLVFNPSSNNLGIATTNPTSKLYVVGDGYFTGVVTATTFVGNLTGTATTATNLANAANITTGTINSSRLSGTYNIDISGNSATSDYADIAGIATYASNAGIATYATSAGVSTSVIGGIASVTQLSVSGVSTLGTVQISSGIVTATSGVVTYYGDGSKLSNITSGITVQDEGSTVGTSVTTLNFSGATVSVSNAVNGISTITVTASGIVTYVDNAGIATNLKGGLTGNIPYQSAPNTTTFLANGSSGTILQSNGVGNAPSWVTAAPAGAITGLTIRDEGTIVGSASSVSTINFVGAIVSAASTAGIATITFLDYVSNAGTSTSVSGGIASVTSLTVSGISTFNGNVYVPSSSVGIGTTNPLQRFQIGTANTLGISTNGTVFVVTSNADVGIGTTNPTSKLHVIGDGRFTGVVTATTFSGNASSATYATSSGIATYATNAGIATYATSAGIATYATSSGIATYATNAGIATYASNAGIATYATSAGIATYATSSGIATYATNAGVSTYATNAGIATSVIGGIASVTSLTVSGISTFNGNVYVPSSSVGIGTTNPGEKLQVAGNIALGTDINRLVSIQHGGTSPALITKNNGSLRLTSGSGSYFATNNSILLTNGGGVLIDAGDSNTNGIELQGGGGGSGNIRVTEGFLLVGTATSSGTESQALQVNSGAYVAGSVGIGTTNPTSKLHVIGDGRFTGVVTATTFSGNASSATYATSAGIATYATNAGIATYASNAGIATALQNSRTFEITGDIVASPISFNGTGNVSLAATIQPNSVALGSDTTGDYVQSISGTANQITVTSGTGEGSTPTLSIPNQFTAPQDVTVTRDLQVNRNLNVTGNITIGGTTATIFSQSLNIFDPDIVLGYRTDAFGNDISNDNTANHGGVALASTEGNPLVQLFIAGIETNPATYKKLMWFKAGTFSGLGTDAWLSNYAVGIGSTQFPTGTRLAVGSVQFAENDLAVVRNINASGVITATSGFSGNASSATYATSAGIATYATSAGIATYATSSGIATYATSAGIATYATSAGIATYASNAGIATYATSAGIATYATSSGIATYATSAGVSTSVIGGIGSITQLQVTGVSTFTNGPVLVGSATSTGTASQRLQVTGGAYVSGSVGIGTTNPSSTFDVRGAVNIGKFGGNGAYGTNSSVTITAQTDQFNNVIYFNPVDATGTPASGNRLSLGINTTTNYGGYGSGSADLFFVGEDNVIYGAVYPKIKIANPNYLNDQFYSLEAVYSGSGIGAYPAYGYIRNELYDATYSIALNGSFAFSVGDRGSTSGSDASNFSSGNEAFVVILNGSTSLFHNKSKKFETSGVGVTVYGNLNVGTGGTVITTTDTGLVGIGTTNPGATLNVVPTSTAIAGLFSGTTSSDMVRITQLGTGNALVVEDSANPDSSPFVVTGIGSVGIGTASPAFTADIAGDARITSTNKMRFGGTAGTTNFYIQYNSSTNSLDFVAG